VIAGAVTPSPSPSPSPSPTPAPTGITIPGLDQLQQQLTDSPACSRDDVSVCGITLRLTGDERLAQILGVVLGTPLRIFLLVVVALIVRRVLHRLIERMADRIALARPDTDTPDQDRPTVAAAILGASALLSSRRELRARTLASLLKSLTTAVIGAVLALMILAELNFQVAPLLASAGVVGVALGIGCQSLVRDFVAGIFIILEDQYGVGDVVNVGEVSGTVEAVNLRVTRLRDVNGIVWYVRNGEILRVGNQSQGWSRAVLDIAVAKDADIAAARELLLQVGRGLREEAAFRHVVVDDPEVWGVEVLTKDEFVLRLVVKTQPLQQWQVARELRRRIKEGFDTAGIALGGEYEKA
jgi:small conductance mechanosensitive channel